jgi:hypothetical protein
MKKTAFAVVVVLAVIACGAAEARSQGGYYSGAYGSSHKGGHNVNPRPSAGNHYTRHK